MYIILYNLIIGTSYDLLHSSQLLCEIKSMNPMHRNGKRFAQFWAVSSGSVGGQNNCSPKSTIFSSLPLLPILFSQFFFSLTFISLGKYCLFLATVQGQLPPEAFTNCPRFQSSLLSRNFYRSYLHLTFVLSIAVLHCNTYVFM